MGIYHSGKSAEQNRANLNRRLLSKNTINGQQMTAFTAFLEYSFLLFDGHFLYDILGVFSFGNYFSIQRNHWQTVSLSAKEIFKQRLQFERNLQMYSKD